jgi:pimeloyl-ACP methyl ester carboxylesterase
MAKWPRYFLYSLCALTVTAVGAVGAVIAFAEPPPIRRLAAGDSLPGADKWDWKSLPAVSRIAARDGAPLAYRRYAGSADRAVVLVHGSSGAGITMHRLALGLQAAGATVYTISLRGHGGSGNVVGDISYKDQLDDDLADFVRAVGLDKPGVHRTLAGFSSGGGFVLRTASGPNAKLFEAYLPISPYVGYGSPTIRPAAGGWVSVAIPRTIALAVLDRLGLPWFQQLTTIRFATDAAPSVNRTPSYSWRLQSGMHLPLNWREEIARIKPPTVVVVGSKDELFFGDQFAPLFATLNPAIKVVMLPELGHMTMISDDRAVAEVTTLWRLVNASRFDFKVREDMFAGFDGDKAALGRAMALIADTLTRDPDNAEALSWRGAGRLFLAGEAFRQQAMNEGLTLASQGVADLERGVALKPDSIGTRAARGPALLIYARGLRSFDKARADALTALAITDFDYILRANALGWSTLAEHDRGEILGALADGWLQLGESEKANAYLDRMIRELPGTPYATNAALHRADRTAKAPLTCLGCH